MARADSGWLGVWIYRAGSRWQWVLVAHCFGGGDAGAAADQVALSFTGQGMAVLSLDFARSSHTDERLPPDWPIWNRSACGHSCSA